MSEIIELIKKCNKCKREIPEDGIYYKHPKHGIICEYCPEFTDGGISFVEDIEETT